MPGVTTQRDSAGVIRRRHPPHPFLGPFQPLKRFPAVQSLSIFLTHTPALIGEIRKIYEAKKMATPSKKSSCLNEEQRQKVIDALVSCLDADDPKVKLRAIEKILAMEKANQQQE